LFAVIMSVIASSALAQTPAPPRPIAGWDDGPFLQSSDGEFRLQFGLLGQFDGRFAAGDDADVLTDTFAIRRFRTAFRGRVTRYFEFALSPDVGSGTLALQDAYIDARLTPAFRIRMGRAKFPVAFERLHSVPYLTFMERALVANIQPNRDVGILALGEAAGGRVSYGGGIVNGARDGASSDADTDDSKEVGGRVLAEVLPGFSLGVAGSTGTPSGADALPSYRTTIFQQVFFSYGPGATAEGRRNRVSGYGSFYRGAFGTFAEYTRSSLPVRDSETLETIGHQAWQIAGTYVLTGEDATDNGVTPRANFNPSTGSWGALQVAARYHTLTVDRAAFDLGLAADDASRKAQAWSVGVNWYLSRMLLYRVLFERTVFDGTAGGARPAENVITFRSQISF
jgi:phosphate-selective porin OprO/OprP